MEAGVPDCVARNAGDLLHGLAHEPALAGIKKATDAPTIGKDALEVAGYRTSWIMHAATPPDQRMVLENAFNKYFEDNKDEAQAMMAMCRWKMEKEQRNSTVGTIDVKEQIDFTKTTPAFRIVEGLRTIVTTMWQNTVDTSLSAWATRGHPQFLTLFAGAAVVTDLPPDVIEPEPEPTWPGNPWATEEEAPPPPPPPPSMVDRPRCRCGRAVRSPGHRKCCRACDWRREARGGPEVRVHHYWCTVHHSSMVANYGVDGPCMGRCECPWPPRPHRV